MMIKGVYMGAFGGMRFRWITLITVIPVIRLVFLLCHLDARDFDYISRLTMRWFVTK